MIVAGRKGRTFRSLRGRFLFYFLTLGALSLVLFAALFAYFIWRENERLERKAREELVDQAEKMARDLEVVFALERRYPEFPGVTVERITQLLRLEGQLINATSALVDRKGTVLAPRALSLLIPRQLSEDLLASQETKVRETEFPRLGKVLVVAIPLEPSTQSSYYNLLVVKRVGDLVTSPGSTLLRYLLLATAVALALAVVLALYLSNYVSRPLRRLSQAAWELAHGNLDSRVEVSGRDEIATLSGYFNYMAERLQRSAEQQRDFVANVSHEIRTPLTSIEGFSQALLEGVVDGEEDRRKYLRIISEESKRLQRVLNQLLALSRIDAGAWALHPSPIEPEELIRELEARFQPLAEEKEVRLCTEISPGLRALRTDRDALELVLTNLLDNALKFTPPGGKVTLCADPLPRGGLRIQVRDTGQGIPEDKLGRIFDRFFRVEPSRSQRHGGSGLGLAVSRELVHLLQGKITVWSKPGEGSIFTVEIPPYPETQEAGERR